MLLARRAAASQSASRRAAGGRREETAACCARCSAALAAPAAGCAPAPAHPGRRRARPSCHRPGGGGARRVQPQGAGGAKRGLGVWRAGGKQRAAASARSAARRPTQPPHLLRARGPRPRAHASVRGRAGREWGPEAAVHGGFVARSLEAPILRAVRCCSGVQSVVQCLRYVWGRRQARRCCVTGGRRAASAADCATARLPDPS